MKPNHGSESNHVGGVDLFDSLEALWRQRVIIVLFAICSTILGYLYTKLAQEEWVAEVEISVASPSAMSSLNLPALDSLTKRNVSIDVDPVDLLGLAIEEMRSIQTLLDFDATLTENIFNDAGQLRDDERFAAAEQFIEDNLEITQSSTNPKVVIIRMVLGSPAKAQHVLNEYVEFVNAKVVEKRLEQIRLALEYVVKANEIYVDRFRSDLQNQLVKKLVLAVRALQTARLSEVNSEFSHCSDFSVDEEKFLSELDLSMYGEACLVKNISILREKIEQINSHRAIRDIQHENVVLGAIVINPDAAAISVVSPAQLPAERYSPNTPLVLLLALVLGGILGALAAIANVAIRSY